MIAELSVQFFDLDLAPVDPALLSEEENQRVARKGTPQLRRRQAAAFCGVRRALGAALGIAPAALPIERRADGKPVLRGAGLHFNLSHSRGVALVALGPRELGVDVEALIARPSDRLAGKVLGVRERAAWAGLEASRRAAWLTGAWVRKESLLKALGTGLRLAPGTIDVDGGQPHGEPQVVALAGRRWSIADLDAGVPEGFRAAVCVEVGGDA